MPSLAFMYQINSNPTLFSRTTSIQLTTPFLKPLLLGAALVSSPFLLPSHPSQWLFLLLSSEYPLLGPGPSASWFTLFLSLSISPETWHIAHVPLVSYFYQNIVCKLFFKSQTVLKTCCLKASGSFSTLPHTSSETMSSNSFSFLLLITSMFLNIRSILLAFENQFHIVSVNLLW